MAASTSFQVVVKGKGGHAAMPHLTVDPVVAATAVVQALQPLVSRETDPVESAVISVTQFNTGSILLPCYYHISSGFTAYGEKGMRYIVKVLARHRR